MKKSIAMILSLLLVLMFSTGSVLAKPDNSNGNGRDCNAAQAAKQLVKEKLDKSIVNQGQSNKESKIPNNAVKNQNKVENTIKIKVELQQKLQLHNPNSSSCKAFADANVHWANNSIIKMTALDIFSGYPDGTFKPDSEITQAELISILAKIMADEEIGDEIDEEIDEDIDEEIDEEIDEDIDEDTDELDEIPEWAKNAVDKACQKGFLNINRFHSQVQASRAQSAVWLAKALELEPVDTSDIPFSDGILISQEDAGYIMALYQEGIISGNPEGQFNPNSAITRAEMASIIDRLLDDEDLDDEDTDEDTDDEDTDDEDTDDEDTDDEDTDDEDTDDEDTQSTSTSETTSAVNNN